MKLNDTQQQHVREWVEEGCGLSEIQRRLASELDLNMTFMDVRFLVLDLGLQIKDKSQEQAPPPPPPVDETAVADALEGAETSGGIQVDIDRVVKPGALVSGTVVFSDGVRATWMLDQMGRLGLDAGTPDYRPSPEDIQAFQATLQRELAKRGF